MNDQHPFTNVQPTSEDLFIMDAIKQSRKPWHNLAYTETLDKMIIDLGWLPSTASRRRLWLKIVSLGKSGLL